jgi:hypothetical protein
MEQRNATFVNRVANSDFLSQTKRNTQFLSFSTILVYSPFFIMPSSYHLALIVYYPETNQDRTQEGKKKDEKKILVALLCLCSIYFLYYILFISSS